MKQHQPQTNRSPPILGSNVKIQQGHSTTTERVYYKYNDGTVDDPQAFQAKFEDVAPDALVQSQIECNEGDALAAINLNMNGTFDKHLNDVDNAGEDDSDESDTSDIDTKGEDDDNTAGDDGNGGNGDVGSPATSPEQSPSYITVEDPLQPWRVGLELRENPFAGLDQRLDQRHEDERENSPPKPSTRSQPSSSAHPRSRTSESLSRRATSRSRTSESLSRRASSRSRTSESRTSSQGEEPTSAYQKPYSSSGPCRTYAASSTREVDGESGGEDSNLSTQSQPDWTAGRRSRGGYSPTSVDAGAQVIPLSL